MVKYMIPNILKNCLNPSTKTYSLNPKLIALDTKFKHRILSHVIGNYIVDTPYPLFLAIHGRKGEGKTFQTLATCHQYGIDAHRISGSSLSGNLERDSVSQLENLYRDLCTESSHDKSVKTIIIDDFHLSVASVSDNVHHTINTQLLIGFLMNLADDAKHSPGYRIPIILIGNDFGKLYAPLVRDGRMDFFNWNPDLDCKTSILVKLYSDIIKNSDIDKFKGFVATYPAQPISFFAELKSDLIKNNVLNIVQQYDTSNAVSILERVNESNILDLDNSWSDSILDRLAELAKSRIDAAVLDAHESGVYSNE